MNNNINNDNEMLKISFSEILFYLFAGSLLFVKGMGFYEGQWPFDIMVIVAYLAYGIRILVSRHSISELFVTIIFTMTGIVIYRTSGELGALFHLTFIVGMFGMDSKRVLKGAYYIWVLTFIVQLITSFIGINPNNIYRIHEKMGQYIVRWSLGYTHPNVLHISYIILIMLIFYVKDFKGKGLIKASVIAFLGSVAVFLWSFSYTGMMITTAYIILNLVLSSIDLDNKIIKFIVYLITPVSILFSVAGPVLITGKAFQIIDKALSTRFTLSNYYLTTQPITWWGTNDFVVTDSSIVLDCSFVYALMHFGIVFFVMMSLGISAVVIWLMRNKLRRELAIVIGLVIAGITEPFLSNTSYKNIALIFVSELLYLALNKIGSKKIVLLSNIGDKELKLDTQKIAKACKRCKDIIVSYKVTIILIMCFMMAAGVLGYRMVVQYPDSLYSLLYKADRKPSAILYDTSEYYYFDINSLPEDFNSWILSYEDVDTPLYRYQGFTLFFEYIRRALGVGAVCALVAIVVYVCWKFMVKGQPKPQ